MGWPWSESFRSGALLGRSAPLGPWSIRTLIHPGGLIVGWRQRAPRPPGRRPTPLDGDLRPRDRLDRLERLERRDQPPIDHAAPALKSSSPPSTSSARSSRPSSRPVTTAGTPPGWSKRSHGGSGCVRLVRPWPPLEQPNAMPIWPRDTAIRPTGWPRSPVRPAARPPTFSGWLTPCHASRGGRCPA